MNGEIQMTNLQYSEMQETDRGVSNGSVHHSLLSLTDS